MESKFCPYQESNCVNCDPVKCAKYRAWVDSKNLTIRNEVLESVGCTKNDSLQVILTVQKYLQVVQGKKNGKKVENLTKEELNERMLMMERAIGDELSEIRQHLNWKDWKVPNWNKLDDLTELKKEVVDILHFLLNMFIILGMNADEIFESYISKNVENILRQKYGY